MRVRDARLLEDVLERRLARQPHRNAVLGEDLHETLHRLVHVLRRRRVLARAQTSGKPRTPRRQRAKLRRLARLRRLEPRRRRGASLGDALVVREARVQEPVRVFRAQADGFRNRASLRNAAQCLASRAAALVFVFIPEQFFGRPEGPAGVRLAQDRHGAHVHGPAAGQRAADGSPLGALLHLRRREVREGVAARGVPPRLGEAKGGGARRGGGGHRRRRRRSGLLRLLRGARHRLRRRDGRGGVKRARALRHGRRRRREVRVARHGGERAFGLAVDVVDAVVRVSLKVSRNIFSPWEDILLCLRKQRVRLRLPHLRNARAGAGGVFAPPPAELRRAPLQRADTLHRRGGDAGLAKKRVRGALVRLKLASQVAAGGRRARRLRVGVGRERAAVQLARERAVHHPQILGVFAQAGHLGAQHAELLHRGVEVLLGGVRARALLVRERVALLLGSRRGVLRLERAALSLLALPLQTRRVAAQTLELGAELLRVVRTRRRLAPREASAAARLSFRPAGALLALRSVPRTRV
mmetsp:Transcript_12131/g.50797  ORF Transcript_12131/g.50797 Transcript_12131/m.50797 type:complete len:527 (+) Transcript_12131:730-2310(+)